MPALAIRRALVLLALSMVPGCGGCKRDTPPTSIEAGVDAQATAKPEAPHLEFAIVKVHEKQTPTTKTPWHEGDGTWTFYDAQLANGGRFGFGVNETVRPPALRDGGETTEVFLTVPDADEGAKLVTEMGKALHAKVPPDVPRQPLLLSRTIASLGIFGIWSPRPNWKEYELGVYAHGLPDGPIVVSLDAAKGRGELRVKEGGKAEDVVAVFARSFRDGPRPMRTPDVDPQVSAVGPKLEVVREIAVAHAFPHVAGSKSMIYVDGGRVMELTFGTNAPPVEIFHAEHGWRSFGCARAADHVCLYQEKLSKPDETDRSALHLIDRRARTSRKLTGPWGERIDDTRDVLAPDGSWVAISTAGPQGQRGVVYLIPTAGGAPTLLAGAGKDEMLDVSGWTGSGPSLRAIVWRSASTPTYVSVEPRTGASTPTEKPADVDVALSPDRKHRVECRPDHTVVVIDVATKAERTFTVDPEEWADVGSSCLEWVSPRYLKLDAYRPGFIDIETMKQSYASDAVRRGYASYTSDFAWAVIAEDEKIVVARVVVR